ncbi:MAG: YHS domain-containing protein [Fimbriimonadales bacterium]|nr:YHS domain-containing protein [Fimbriimonadales bacterium]
MITTLLAVAAISVQGTAPETICPVGQHDSTGMGLDYYYRGVQYTLCCEGCIPKFNADPKKYTKEWKDEGIIGVAQFDVITKKRIDYKKAVAHSDYNGVRYYFASEASKKAFDADPKKLSAVPEKEVIDKCPVMGEEINIAKLPDYVDHEGVRYYFCCAGCGTSFSKDPAKYASTVTPKDAIVHKMPEK